MLAAQHDDDIYIYIYIYIYWQHFFIDTYLIEHNKKKLSTYVFVEFSNCRIDLMICGGNWLITLP